MDRWYLLTDRKLKGYQLYGPFPTADAADEIARQLLERDRIREWTVVIAQVPPRLENGAVVYTAEIDMSETRAAGRGPRQAPEPEHTPVYAVLRSFAFQIDCACGWIGNRKTMESDAKREFDAHKRQMESDGIGYIGESR
jgi:hypothetical protein